VLGDRGEDGAWTIEEEELGGHTNGDGGAAGTWEVPGTCLLGF